MPSSSTNKKRANSIDSAQKCPPKCRKRKRSISSDEEEEELDESATAIEKKLRTVAKMNNLSQVEMKKLIKKLVANDHVLAFITLKAEDELAREKEEAEKTQTAAVIVNDIDPSIPKLTRAKARELNKPPLIALPSLMEPQPSEIASLIQEDLHSDEEDEEYTFKDEDFVSDEDQNLTSSDMESQPRTPMTPYQCQEIAESPQKLSADGVFKVPRGIEAEPAVEDEIIATRTRSKFCLQQTTIEDLQSEFIPPDDHIDLMDNEVNGNDLEWMEFLNTFSKPLNNSFVGDDDDPVNDPEYVAAEKVPFDAEELRDVNISKKELTELVAELFEGLLNEGVCMESIELETPKKFVENNKSASSKENTQNASMSINESHLSIMNESQSAEAVSTIPPISHMNFEPVQELTFHPGVMSTPQALPPRTRSFKDELFVKTDNLGPVACTQYIPPSAPAIPPVPVPFEISYPNPTAPLENPIIIKEHAVPTAEPPKTPSWPREYYVPTQRLIRDEYVHKFEKLKNAPVPDVNLSEEPTGFTSHQFQILQQQLRIHVQFCVQNFFQTYSHPDLWAKAAQQKDMLLELESRSQENATFGVWNLQPALSLVQEWEKELNEDNEENSEFMRFVYKELRRSKTKTNHQVARFPPRIMKKLLSSPAILYPSYLPKIPFAAPRVTRLCYAPSESILIAMGLERYSNDALNSKRTYRREAAMSIICRRIGGTLTPGKNFRQIRDIIASLRKSENYNPIKYFYEHERAPPVEHKLEWIDFENVQPPNQRIAELPMMWQDFIHVLNAGGIINDTYPENYLGLIKQITGEQIDFPSLASGSSRSSNRSVKWSKKQRNKEKENEAPSVTININYVFGTPPVINPTCDENQVSTNLLALPDSQAINTSLCLSPLKNTTNTANTSTTTPLTTPERQKKLTDYYPIKEKEILIDTVTRPKAVPRSRPRKANYRFKSRYSLPYFSKKLQATANKFRSAKNLQKRYENLLSAYRLNLETTFMTYKNRELRSVFRNCKALELYTNLLRDLKMNCKKAKATADDAAAKRKQTEEQEVPKSRKANRQEENLRHMLLPDSPEDANRKDAIYAFNFYEKVEEVLKQSKRPEDCKKFNHILRSFDPKKDKVSELYYKLEKLFIPDHPELAHVFLTFLLPHEAAEIGKFFEHFMYTNAGTFFNKLNVYFNKQPAQIRKIYACLNELSNDPDVNVDKMKSKIFPLLKGNSFLIDWFTQLFSSELPPERLYGSAENMNMKEIVSNQAGDIETLHPNDLLDSPTESQTCQLRYINGRIFYGTKIPLPAKLSFIAKSYQADELNESLEEDEKHTPTESGCVHGIREYGEKRLSASINDCSSDDNDKSEEEEFKAILTDLNENESFEICDDATLRAHANRLNPSYYSNSYCHASASNPQSTCHRPLKISTTIVEDGKGSPRKMYKASPSAPVTSSSSSSSSSVAAFKERRKSPKKNLVKSPLLACKRPAPADTTISASKSNAIATAKKLKNLIEEASYSDSEAAKKKQPQKKKEDEDLQAQAKEDARLSPKKEMIKTETVTQPWTRDEDKVILEEIKSGFKDQLLYERINAKITNRSLLEIEERNRFLMDFLSKLQGSK